MNILRRGDVSLFSWDTVQTPPAPPALAGASPLLFTIRISGAPALAPPCSPNHFCIFQAAGGATGLLSRDCLIPHLQLRLCCVMVGRGDEQTDGRRVLLSHRLLPQPPSGWWVKGQLSSQAGGSETSRKGQKPPIYHIVCKAPSRTSQN